MHMSGDEFGGDSGQGAIVPISAPRGNAPAKREGAQAPSIPVSWLLIAAILAGGAWYYFKVYKAGDA